MQVENWRDQIEISTRSTLQRRFLEEEFERIYARAMRRLSRKGLQNTSSVPSPTAAKEGLTLEMVLSQEWWPESVRYT